MVPSRWALRLACAVIRFQFAVPVRLVATILTTMTNNYDVVGAVPVDPVAAAQPELDKRVAKLSSQGYAIESRTPTQVVLAKKSRIGWFWNVVLALVTAGLWLIYVAYRLINRKSDRIVLTVTPTGKIKQS